MKVAIVFVGTGKYNTLIFFLGIMRISKKISSQYQKDISSIH